MLRVGYWFVGRLEEWVTRETISLAWRHTCEYVTFQFMRASKQIENIFYARIKFMTSRQWASHSIYRHDCATYHHILPQSPPYCPPVPRALLCLIRFSVSPAAFWNLSDKYLPASAGDKAFFAMPSTKRCHGQWLEPSGFDIGDQFVNISKLNSRFKRTIVLAKT